MVVASSGNSGSEAQVRELDTHLESFHSFKQRKGWIGVSSNSAHIFKARGFGNTHRNIIDEAKVRIHPIRKDAQPGSANLSQMRAIPDPRNIIKAKTNFGT